MECRKLSRVAPAWSPNAFSTGSWHTPRPPLPRQRVRVGLAKFAQHSLLLIRGKPAELADLDRHRLDLLELSFASTMAPGPPADCQQDGGFAKFSIHKNRMLASQRNESLVRSIAKRFGESRPISAATSRSIATLPIARDSHRRQSHLCGRLPVRCSRALSSRPPIQFARSSPWYGDRPRDAVAGWEDTAAAVRQKSGGDFLAIGHHANQRMAGPAAAPVLHSSRIFAARPHGNEVHDILFSSSSPCTRTHPVICPCSRSQCSPANVMNVRPR